MLVDSHCHLNRLELGVYDGTLDNALRHANEQDVGYFLCVCIDLETFPEILAIARSRSDVAVSVGVHPNEEEGEEPSVERLVSLAQHPEVVAIGETGLDYFRSRGELDWQRERFRRHIACARQSNKPLIVHMREATADTLQVLKEEGADQVGGVMHCFVEDWEVAKQAMDLNFHISFSGIVTFRSADTLRDVARRMPLDRMLVETDAPYLAPMPHRGKPNYPAYVRLVAEHIAAVRGIPYEEVAKKTTENFFHLFKDAKAPARQL